MKGKPMLDNICLAGRNMKNTQYTDTQMEVHPSRKGMETSRKRRQRT